MQRLGPVSFSVLATRFVFRYQNAKLTDRTWSIRVDEEYFTISFYSGAGKKPLRSGGPSPCRQKYLSSR